MIFLFFTSPLAPLEAEICPIEVWHGIFIILRNFPTDCRSEKYLKRFSYKSKTDTLKNDWHRMIKNFSDRIPILYNGCLWTTTRSAQLRHRNPNHFKGPKILIQQNIQKMTVRTLFPNRPQEVCIYKIKKDIRLELCAQKKLPKIK